MEKFPLKICIIGAGRLGTSLAYIIIKKNNPQVSVTSIASRSDESLNNAKDIIKNMPDLNILFTKNNLAAAHQANCIFICTPDDEIEKVCRELFEDSKLHEILFVMHFSGSKKMDALNSAKKEGASVACMHPLKSFASVAESIKTMENTLYGVTYDKNDSEIKKVVDLLLDLLAGKQIFIENSIKPLYHACACIASNLSLIHI